jgi:hypothetical protein
LIKLLKHKQRAKIHLESLISKQRYNENMILQIDHERQKVETQAVSLEKEQEQLKSFLHHIKNLSDDEPFAQAQRLAQSFPELFKTHSVAVKLAKRHLDRQPRLDFKQSLSGFDAFLEARNIMTLAADQSTDFLYLCFERYWLPTFREYLLTGSRLQQVQSTVSQWRTLMPDKFLEKLVFTLLMPRLTREVQSQDGTGWVLPWEEIVGQENMRTLFETEYKPKINKVLTEFRPENDTIIELIKPW